MWVKISDDLPDNPKLKRLCRTMGWDEDQAIGKLYRLWRWAYKYAEDGKLTDFTTQDIEDAMNYTATPGTPDLVQVLTQVGFLDSNPYLRIHDWHHYALQFLNKKYSGTDNDDIPKIVKRAYKSRRTSRPVTVREQSGNRPLDVDVDVDLEKSETTSRKSGVKHQTAPGNEDTSTACSSELGQVNDAPEPTAPGLTELLEFMRTTPPPRAHTTAPIDPIAACDGRTMQTELARYQLFGMKALWTIYIKPGHQGFDWARKRRFIAEEFLRQIPHLVDTDDYPPLKRRFLDEARIPVEA